MTYQYSGFSEETCTVLRGGGLDANAQAPETAVSDGGGNPCRCCLDDIPQGHGMLIFAHRPFGILNPYAETGPVFICAECTVYLDTNNMPPVLTARPRHLLKGYSANDRIVYGSGEIVDTSDIPAYLDSVFADLHVRYVHVRSATNNCFTLRIDRSNRI